MRNGEKAGLFVLRVMLAMTAAVGLGLYAVVPGVAAVPMFLAAIPRFFLALAEPIPARRFLAPVPGLRLNHREPAAAW